MSALSAPRADLSNKGPIVRKVDRACKGSKTFYNGALVALDSGGYLIPATGAAGERVVGWVELANLQSFASSATDGADMLAVSMGIVPMKIGASTDALTQPDIGNDVFAIDDQTVGRLPGSGRPKAGQLFALDTTAGLAYVGIGVETPHAAGAVGGGTAYQGPGSSDAVATPAAIPVTTEISKLIVDGTDAATLADGLFKGQRKVCVVVAGTNTPVCTITPATPVGFATVTALGAVGDTAEFLWDGAAWLLVNTQGATIT